MTKSGKDFLLKLTKFCCMDAINEQILMVHKKQILTTRIILHLQYSALITCNRSLMSYYTRTLDWTGDLLYLSLCELQTTITTFHIESYIVIDIYNVTQKLQLIFTGVNILHIKGVNLSQMLIFKSKNSSLKF